ncbi:TPA: prepilin-type N-terminal cleavage/methylation domain-containing protein [Enterobacter soli]
MNRQQGFTLIELMVISTANL